MVTVTFNVTNSAVKNSLSPFSSRPWVAHALKMRIGAIQDCAASKEYLDTVSILNDARHLDSHRIMPDRR